MSDQTVEVFPTKQEVMENFPHKEGCQCKSSELEMHPGVKITGYIWLDNEVEFYDYLYCPCCESTAKFK